jgi:dihydrofolate reductase
MRRGTRLCQPLVPLKPSAFLNGPGRPWVRRQVFICGGAQIYEQTLPLCSELFLTLVKREVQGDAFFPPFEDRFELAEEIRDTPEFKILRYQNRAALIWNKRIETQRPQRFAEGIVRERAINGAG